MGKGNNRGGGLITGIKNNIPFREANIDLRSKDDEITESLTIEIPTKVKQKLRLTNIYIPPIRNTATEIGRQRKALVKTEKWPNQKYDCILGDVNAHSPFWNKERTEADQRGDTIEEWIANTGMTAINDGSTTRTNRSNSCDTSPDISLIHSSLAGKFTWTTTEEMSSDHKPIIATYRELKSIPTIQSRPSFKWRFKDANWLEYGNQVEDEIPDYRKKKNPKKLMKKLEKIIKKGGTQTCNKEESRQQGKARTNTRNQRSHQETEPAKKNCSNEQKRVGGGVQ